MFALIFHPSHIENLEFQCEGLTDFKHSPAWQVHFVEGDDPNRAFTAIKMGGSIHLPRFKGRAWISADGYNVLRIETDLVDPIAKIDVQREHQVIPYADGTISVFTLLLNFSSSPLIRWRRLSNLMPIN